MGARKILEHGPGDNGLAGWPSVEVDESGGFPVAILWKGMTVADDPLYKQEGYALIGAAMEVYNVQGHGFSEEVYQECLEIQLDMEGIPYESQPQLTIRYKGRELSRRYRPDLYVCGGIVVELKATKKLGDHDIAQLMNYLRATGKRVGYLINFGNPDELEWRRVVI